MQIVIDIPKEQYENLAKIANDGKEPLGYWERVVMRGVPLPKGHGRLIDADELKEQIRRSLVIKSFDYLLPAEKAIVEQIDHTDTIIPADNGESEE